MDSSLLESEIRMAIKEMKNKKNTGIDNIPAEMIKRLGEKATEELVLLFIHSFRPFYSASSWPLLLRSAPDTAQIMCRSFTPRRHRKLLVKDLPKDLTWRLERDSNPQPSGRKASTLPMRHHVPQTMQIYVRKRRVARRL